MNRFLSTSAVICLCLSAAAFARPPQHTVTQSQMDSTAGHAWKSADAALRKFYKAYSAVLDPGQRKLFEVVSTSWLTYRKAYCEFQASAAVGGSVYPMVYADCMANQATMRLKELRNALVTPCRQEGNLSCPAWGPSLPNNSSKQTGGKAPPAA